MKKALLLFFTITLHTVAHTQSLENAPTQQGIFDLGEVSVFGSPTDSSTLSAKKIAAFNRVDYPIH